MRYLLHYLGDDKRVIDRLSRKTSNVVHHKAPFCCLTPWQMGYHFLLGCKVGVLQYVTVLFLFSIVSLVLFCLGWYEEGDYSYSGAYLYTFIVLCYSQTFALYSLFMFYYTLHSELKGIRPFEKFLCIKMVIFFSWWQGVCVGILVSLGHISGIESENGRRHSSQEVADGVQDLLICMEMLFASFAFLYSFPISDFQPPSSLKSSIVPTSSQAPPASAMLLRANILTPSGIVARSMANASSSSSSTLSCVAATAFGRTQKSLNKCIQWLKSRVSSSYSGSTTRAENLSFKKAKRKASILPSSTHVRSLSDDDTSPLIQAHPGAHHSADDFPTNANANHESSSRSSSALLSKNTLMRRGVGANNPRAKVRGSGGGDAGILGGPLGLEDQDLESQQVEKSLFEKHAMSRDKLDEHREKALIASSTNENIKQNTRDSSAPSLQQTLFAAERNIDDMLSPSNPRKSLADDMVNMDDSLHQLVTISSNPDLQKPLDTKSSGSAFWGGGGGKSVSEMKDSRIGKDIGIGNQQRRYFGANYRAASKISEKDMEYEMEIGSDLEEALDFKSLCDSGDDIDILPYHQENWDETLDSSFHDISGSSSDTSNDMDMGKRAYSKRRNRSTPHYTLAQAIVITLCIGDLRVDLAELLALVIDYVIIAPSLRFKRYLKGQSN